jgi:hypothetical protein
MAKLYCALWAPLFVAIIFCPAMSSAATIYAKTGYPSDLQTAINKARTGDTVVVPAGRFSFTGSVMSPDGIYIRGAGRDSTFLIKADNTSNFMIFVDNTTGSPFKFSGITMQGRLDALQGSNRTTKATSVTDGGLYIRGAATNFQIFNSRFTKFLRAGIEFQGDAGTRQGPQRGVIYGNEFIDNWYPTLGYGVAVDGSASTWSRSVTLGTANAVFVEDNLFQRNRHCVTATNGAIFVARYNRVQDTYQLSQSFDAHGLTGAWPRGTRAVEIYKNTTTNSTTTWAGAGIRGGSGVIWGNSFSGVSHGIVLSLEPPPSSHPLKSYAALDQIGDPDKLYIWGNTSTSSIYLNPTSDPHGIGYWLKAGRDYFTTAKPGYRPYTYPHPLRSGS